LILRSIIAFLDGVLGEIKEEFEEEAQFIKKQCAACAFAIRAVAEHYSKKLLSLAKTISSPAMDSPNHHALAFEEIFGRSAASKIVSLGGGDSTLVRAEAKKVARAAMAELQKRVLLNTINQETQQPEVVHALSLIESVRFFAFFPLNTVLTISLQRPTAPHGVPRGSSIQAAGGASANDVLEERLSKRRR
jgi:hypothetical protein